MSERIVLVGASVRAAAISARRAGLLPLAADLFADRDLTECCPTIRVTDYPLGFVSAVRKFPPAPWAYCGGLENFSAVVDTISADRPLLGNPGRVLGQVRDPVILARTLRDAGLNSPDVTSSLPQRRLGPWLRKPLGSSAGYGIQKISPNETMPAGGDGAYFQQHIDGLACSAVFVAAAGSAVLIGITEQLVGCDWLGTSRFRYCGSVGPLPTSDAVRAAFVRIGECLASRFELTGLFGVDAVLAGEQVWPVEVNPRYTASVEVLERTLGVEALRFHWAACRGEPLPPLTRVAHFVCGKAILFANATTTIPREFADFVRDTNRDSTWPDVADIPHVGVSVARHQPLTTLFAAGSSIDLVRTQLRQRAATVRAILNPPPAAAT